MTSWSVGTGWSAIWEQCTHRMKSHAGKERKKNVICILIVPISSYGFRPRAEVGDMSGLKEMPFQCQILFRRSDGTRVLRVATARIELTADREEAERGADIKVVATHAAQSAAAKAKKGNLKEAQLQVRAAQRLMARRGDEEKLQAWSKNVADLDSALQEGEDEGEASPVAQHNNNNNNNEAAAPPPRSAFGKKSKKKNDTTAVKVSKMTSANQNALFE